MLLIAALCLVTEALSAQVIFRNDFVINRKQRKLENKGITLITVNLDNRPNWNQLINGRGGNTLRVDVRAIRNPRKEYTYREIAERVYVPEQINAPVFSTVPLHLVLPPPLKRIPAAQVRHRNVVL